MDAPPLGRYLWQGNYVWGEPVIGSRREWKRDKWRYVKLGSALVIAFIVSALANGSITPVFLEFMAGVSLLILIYFWALSFAPRRIVLSKNELSIYRGARSISPAFSTPYSEINEITVAPDGKYFRIYLKLTSGKDMEFYSPDAASAKILDGFVKSNARAVSIK